MFSYGLDEMISVSGSTSAVHTADMGLNPT